MLTLTRRCALVGLLAVLGLGLVSTTAEAGFRPRPVLPPRVPTPVVNPNIPAPPPQLSMQQSFNLQVMRAFYANNPGYLAVYNPYLPAYNPYLQVTTTWSNYPYNYGYRSVSVYSGVNPYVLYSGLYNPYVYGNLNPTVAYAYAYLYQ